MGVGGDASWIELRLTARPTTAPGFQLEHIAHVDDERWAQFGPGAVGVGWDGVMGACPLHLASGEALARPSWPRGPPPTRAAGSSRSPATPGARPASPPAPPEAEAPAAADRTSAFYTGTPA